MSPDTVTRSRTCVSYQLAMTVKTLIKTTKRRY